MAPNQATVETGLSVQQSALRTTSEDYCTLVRDAGWVSDGAGLVGLARILMNGQDKNAATVEDYAARIGAETADPADVLATISADARAASAGLVDVTREALAVMSGDGGASRADVMSFERSLVSAQTAHRSFAGALDLAARRGAVDPSVADLAIAEFATRIDNAGTVADRLAARYSASDRGIS